MGQDILGPANATNAVTSRPADSRSFGAIDSWFKDCTSPTANDGTKLQAGFMNAVIAQLRSTIRGNGLTAALAQVVSDNNTDDNMLLEAIQHLIQRNQPRYGDDSGTADHLIVSLTPAMAEYKVGSEIIVKVAADNLTTAPDANINGLGVRSLVYDDGTTPQKGDLKAGARIRLIVTETALQLAPVRSSILNVKRSQIVADRGGSSQVVPTGVFTRVTNYGTVINNSNGGSTFASGLLTIGPNDGGLWFISFHTRQDFSAGNSGFTNGIYINGSTTPIVTDGSPSVTSGTVTCHGAGGRLFVLSPGDTVEMKLEHNQGTSVTFNDLYDMTAVRLGS